MQLSKASKGFAYWIGNYLQAHVDEERSRVGDVAETSFMGKEIDDGLYILLLILHPVLDNARGFGQRNIAIEEASSSTFGRQYDSSAVLMNCNIPDVTVGSCCNWVAVDFLCCRQRRWRALERDCFIEHSR
jgi:hypothetical protein